MPLPVSGTIKLSQIKAEFGGSVPPQRLTAYLADKGYVVKLGANTDRAPNVPSDPPVYLSNFRDAAKNSLVVTVNTTEATGSRAQGNATTNSVTVTVTGGSGDYSYTWSTEPEPGVTLVTNGGTTATASWSHLITSAEDLYSGAAACSVYDKQWKFYKSSPTVTISISGIANTGTGVSLSPSSISAMATDGSGTLGPYTVTASASGGTGPYTYSWQATGDTSIGTSFSGATASVSQKTFSTATSPTTVYLNVTATDALGRWVGNNCPVTLGCYSALSASVTSSVSASGTGAGGYTTNAAYATPGGGTGSYSYSWAYVSGSSFTINDYGSYATFSTNFGSSGGSASGTYRVTVSDGVNTPKTADVSVSFSVAADLPPALPAPTFINYNPGYCSVARGSCTASGDVTATCTTAGVSYAWSLVSGSHSYSAVGATLYFSKSLTAAIGGATSYSTFRCTVSKSGYSDSYADVTVATVHERTA